MALVPRCSNQPHLRDTSDSDPTDVRRLAVLRVLQFTSFRIFAPSEGPHDFSFVSFITVDGEEFEQEALEEVGAGNLIQLDNAILFGKFNEPRAPAETSRSKKLLINFTSPCNRTDAQIDPIVFDSTISRKTMFLAVCTFK